MRIGSCWMSGRVRGPLRAAGFEWPARSASSRRPERSTFWIMSTRGIGSWTRRPSTSRAMCSGSRNSDTDSEGVSRNEAEQGSEREL